MITKIESAIISFPPERRRRLAIHILLWSVILMFVNDVLYLIDIVNEAALIFVTLNLSWLAITITAVDVVMTTDVRVEEGNTTNE